MGDKARNSSGSRDSEHPYLAPGKRGPLLDLLLNVIGIKNIRDLCFSS